MAGINDKWIKTGHLTGERYATMVEHLLDLGRLGDLNLLEPDPSSVKPKVLEALVTAFQTVVGLEADGVAGPATARVVDRLTGRQAGKPTGRTQRPTQFAAEEAPAGNIPEPEGETEGEIEGETAVQRPARKQRKLAPEDAQRLLRLLGYYEGRVDGDLLAEPTMIAVRKFQTDHKLRRDGVYGPATEKVLVGLDDALDAHAPSGMKQMRRWHLTYYYLANEGDYSGKRNIPMQTNEGGLIAMVTPRFFAASALEGSGTLEDGRLINVANRPDYIDADGETFSPVFQFAKRNKWIPNKSGYAGIRTDGRQATAARAFRVVNRPGKGWGVLRGIPLEPFRTLAADIGIQRIRRHDRSYVDKGGVVPPKTRVFILEFAGRQLPDGTVHDGWFVVNDTGGGIFGAHFDMFTGSYRLGKAARIPPRAHIWFDGIEDRIPLDYDYGLAGG